MACQWCTLVLGRWLLLPSGAALAPVGDGRGGERVDHADGHGGGAARGAPLVGEAVGLHPARRRPGRLAGRVSVLHRVARRLRGSERGVGSHSGEGARGRAAKDDDAHGHGGAQSHAAHRNGHQQRKLAAKHAAVAAGARVGRRALRRGRPFHVNGRVARRARLRAAAVGLSFAVAPRVARPLAVVIVAVPAAAVVPRGGHAWATRATRWAHSRGARG
jgi:hypothetical protein